MLAMNKYPKAYIEECRTKMKKQLAAYKALSSTASDKAAAAFEPLFFNNLVLVLDQYFVNRTRALELKDGNPLNEVRMLASSILQNDAVLAADKTIKFDAAKSVTKLSVGDKIKLSSSDFERLFKAYFAEIETKFM